MAKSKYPSGYTFKKRKKTGKFTLLIMWITFIYAVAVALSFLGNLSWVTDLFSHFPLQYLFIGLLLSLLLLMGSKKRGALIALCLGLLQLIPLQNAWNFEGLLQDKKAAETIPADQKLSETLNVMMHNLHLHNRDKDELINNVIKQKDQLDVVIFQETSPEWIPFLSKLKKVFSFHQIKANNGPFGYAIFSSTPTEKLEIINEKTNFPIAKLKAYTNIKRIPFTIYTMHTPPPLSAEHWDKRNKMLNDAIKLVNNDTSENIILTGDLNITPYSPFFRQMKRNTELVLAKQNITNLGTWPSYVPSFLRIPIDHKLVSKNITITERALGDQTGSDHMAVISTLELSKARKQAVIATPNIVKQVQPEAPKDNALTAILGGEVKTIEQAPIEQITEPTIVQPTPTQQVITSVKTAPIDRTNTFIEYPSLDGEKEIVKKKRVTSKTTRKPKKKTSSLEQAVKDGLLPKTYLNNDPSDDNYFDSNWEPLSVRKNMPKDIKATLNNARRPQGNWAVSP